MLIRQERNSKRENCGPQPPAPPPPVAFASPTEQTAKIDIALSNEVRGKPFLTFRSMYVTESNADSARVEWKTPGAKGWREAPVMQFKGGEATTFRLGRVVPSRHNTSAPDMFAGPFVK